MSILRHCSPYGDDDNKTEMALMLIDNGIVITAPAKHIGTALHMAVRSRRIEMIRILLAKGADINARYRNWTAVDVAISWLASYEVFELLFQHGAKERDWHRDQIVDILMVMAKTYALGDAPIRAMARSGLLTDIPLARFADVLIAAAGLTSTLQFHLDVFQALL